MDESGQSPTRAQRLAAKLRENLRRRKAQARALDDAEGLGACEAGHEAKSAAGSAADGAGLSKTASNR